jgi:hypothetical protein
MISSTCRVLALLLLCVFLATASTLNPGATVTPTLFTGTLDGGPLVSGSRTMNPGSVLGTELFAAYADPLGGIDLWFQLRDKPTSGGSFTTAALSSFDGYDILSFWYLTTGPGDFVGGDVIPTNASLSADSKTITVLFPTISPGTDSMVFGFRVGSAGYNTSGTGTLYDAQGNHKSATSLQPAGDPIHANTSTPEPASFVLLIAGLAIFGLPLRRNNA